MALSTFLIILFVALLILYFLKNVFRIFINLALGILAFLIYFASKIAFVVATVFVAVLIYIGFFKGKEKETKTGLRKYSEYIVNYFKNLYQELLVKQIKNPPPNIGIFIPKSIPTDKLRTKKLK